MTGTKKTEKIKKEKMNIPEEIETQINIAQEIVNVLNKSKLTPKQVYGLLQSLCADTEQKYFNDEEGKRFVNEIGERLKLAKNMQKIQQLKEKTSSNVNIGVEGRPKYIG